MRVDFSSWKGDELTRAYTFRYQDAPVPKQTQSGIETQVNPAHKEGFDNVSYLSKEKYSAGVMAELKCSFEGTGCPEIILVENAENCLDGVVRYGACFEIVLYKGGVNIWRHYMDENRVCSWHRRLGVEWNVPENEVHTLTVHVKENEIGFSVDGIAASVRTEDIFKEFHVGLTLCEGIARAHEMVILE